MTNFIAATLNAGMGIYVGKKISPTLMNQAFATLDSFLFNLEQQEESAAHDVEARQAATTRSAARRWVTCRRT